ncbi:MAG: response regulator transcription factor [Deltaproteobacteria bacterium]|nr:response regulator transcription factor [Deltaproteobacteria bacterium]MBW1818771.1 response regulator transcription factor [Deltaproteobacteria bacterium]
MTEIKAIIADDEAPLRSHLRLLLSEVWPELTICGEAQNGHDALALIRKASPHIAFLDIRMPGLTGMEVAREIAGICHVVFVTAYDQYAVEAFENEAADYLLKPVGRERLERTVNRLKERMAETSEPPEAMPNMMERLMARLSEREASGYLNWLRVSHGDGIRLIPVEEVCYFKASDKYTLVMTADGESLIRKPIKELEAELDPKKFWRIHRGTVVNVDCISDVSRSLTGRGALRLKDRPEILAVSKGFMHLFRQM